MNKIKLMFATVAVAMSGFSIDLVISPASMNWFDQEFVEFSISNLTVGAEVKLAVFIDLNGNGVIDSTDLLAAQFELEDGQTNAFGAVTLVDDNDGIANGMIDGFISFYGKDYLHSIGDYVWEVVELDGSGSPLETNTATFSVTQPQSATRIIGEVQDYVSSNTVSGAYVELEYYSDTTGVSPSTWADENGAFSIYLPSGVSSNQVLGIYAAAAGYMSTEQHPSGDLISLAVFTNGLTIGEHVLPQPLFVVPSIPNYDLVDVTGSVYLIKPADGGGFETNALPGALVDIETLSFGDDDNDGDILSFDISDASGAFSLVFSSAADEWDSATISCAHPLLTMRGLVPSPVSIVLAGPTNGVALYCRPAEALVSGTVTGLSTGTPLAGMEVVLSSGNDTLGSTFTSSNGTYEIGLLEGSYTAQCEDEVLTQKHYVYTNEGQGYRSVENLFSGEVRNGQDLSFESGFLVSGHVYSSGGTPLGGGSAILVEPSEDNWEYRMNSCIVAFDGYYELLSAAGIWNVRTENDTGSWIDLYHANTPIWNSVEATSIVVTNANVGAIDFYLSEGTRLQGSVLTADSSIPWETQMSAFRLNGSKNLERIGSGRTDWDSGAFDFVVPSGGDIYLRADSDGQQTPDTWLGNVGSHSLSPVIHPVLGITQSNLNIQILAGYQVSSKVTDQRSLTDIPNPTIIAFDASSNQYGTAINQWGSWIIFVPTNTPLTFFANAQGYEGEFMTNTYDLAEAGYFQRPENHYIELEFVLHASSSDTDGDGLPDYIEDSVPDNELWPEDYSNPKNSDTDGDTVNDGDEYIAGTNPRNANSIFKIVESTPSGTTITLRWSSVPNREYTVQTSSDLTSGSWSNIHTVVASGTEITYAPTTTGEHDYYRVQVAQPLAP